MILPSLRGLRLGFHCMNKLTFSTPSLPPPSSSQIPQWALANLHHQTISFSKWAISLNFPSAYLSFYLTFVIYCIMKNQNQRGKKKKNQTQISFGVFISFCPQLKNKFNDLRGTFWKAAACTLSILSWICRWVRGIWRFWHIEKTAIPGK